MTEHRRIPVPRRPQQGLSLFERAESLFGDQGFVPAPVPGNLAPPVNRMAPSRSQPVKRLPTAPDDEPFRFPPMAPRAPLPEASLQADPVADPAVQPVTDHGHLTTPPQTAPVVFDAVALPDHRYPVDRGLLAHHGLIDPEGPVTGLMEEFRIVKRQLLKAARADSTGRSRRILVTSPLPNEGKTFCAINLALAMAAERDCEVVLVDADVAKPSILSMLGLPKGLGLMDALANPSIRVEDCVIGTDIDGLHVLPAGNQTNADSEYLAAAETAGILDRLTLGARGRVLVFDSPPTLAASPAADLANLVGQAVVVTRADQTGQSALEDALTLLSNCPDIKLLLNDAHFSPSGRRFGGYYGYGG
ncbi:capsular biosynthesis protein [Alteraurantiacibacter buctensis]|uniref:Capsular biosynthesis protein n=1 Tax=Alteraurantiacibacter buctensis TaxID=1503981 RepID=A0A844YZ41_9SPHN|nr:capsular biosynthesis protein [Alteraurantiacibacter buctensis]MXO72328.1 capsular biosynthesis protein [Alteraurantiacibacter buctensis]